MRILRGIGIALAIVAGACATARADGPPVPTLTSMRTWASPTGTRVVFDFSVPVTLVAPDTGSARQLTIAVPHPGIVRGGTVPPGFAVRDSAIDSVRAVIDANGARLLLYMGPQTRFHVFSLAPTDDKPFRIVVDVTLASAAAAEERRLANLANTKRRDRVRLVTIDAGHGGEDTGARGPGNVFEKNVTLGIARALADELNKLPGVRAMLTRDDDFFIPLRERYRIAEKVRADLFISIHCNSSKRRGSGSGTEVYFLSLKGASDQADADLADIENAADLVGGVPEQAEDDVVGVLYSMKRNTALQRSQLLAETLLDHVAEDRRIESRGIKQAGFAVLKSVEFPSVLVETAFINNPREVLLLKNPDFQKGMAKQLATGVRTYFERAGAPLAPDSTRATAAGGSGAGQ